MKAAFSSLLTFLLLTTSAFAQNRANTWYFRGGEGINFNTNPPSLLTNGSIATAEGCAAISDTSGNLQFYTDGVTLYDSSHNPMPNGSGLLGNISTTQSALIIPQPQHPNRYYVFTSAQTCGTDGFRYSVVDMNLNNGLGDVLPTFKNVPLLSPTFEKMAAVHHCNGEDIWIMAIEATTGDFYTWLVTKNGLCNCPIVTQTGPVHEEGFSAMKFSNNGKRLVVLEAKGACGSSRIHTDLYDFDNNAGVPTFVQTIDTAIISSSGSGGSFWGASFSPNNQMLYMSTGFTTYNGSAGTTQSTAVVQYDLNATVIESSAVIVWDDAVASGGCGSPMGGLQLGPDGRIYVGNNCPNGMGIDVIENPNVPGTGCTYTHGALPGAVGAGYGMTYFIESYFGEGIDACDSLISEDMCQWIFDNNCPVVSADPVEAQPEMQVIPNPFSESARLVFPNKLGTAHSAKLYDISGKLVRQLSSVTTNSMTIERGGLPQGIYFLRLFEDGKVKFTTKVLMN